MLNSLISVARPLLLGIDPEKAHDLATLAIEKGLYPRHAADRHAALKTEAMGLEFPNPIGNAAGFDKDARVPDATLAMGAGFAEVGTITPLPQTGNPKPRLFRLTAERAVINRFGFNNQGHEAAFQRLAARGHRSGIVGINIGANKDAADRAADYVLGIERFYLFGSYFTVNISSPNTPGLRDLQAPAALDELLSRVMAARNRLAARHGVDRPVVVKIAPDIAEEDLPAIVGRMLANDVDAIAISNTTLARPGVEAAPLAKEAGGLSGRPLFHRSTVVLARVHELVGGKVPLIGIGGIDSGATAIAKMEAGATLIQLYTGLVFEGPELFARIADAMAQTCRSEGLANIGAIVGRRAGEWAAKPLEA